MQFDLGAYNSVFYGNTFAPYLKEAPSLMNKKDSTGMYKNVNLQIGTVEFSNANIGFMQNFGNKILKIHFIQIPQAYWNDRIRHGAR